MFKMASTQASRGKLHEAVGRARYAGVRTVITVRGEDAAALVPIADLLFLLRTPPEAMAVPSALDATPEEEAR